MPGPVQLSVLLTTHSAKQDFDSLLLHLLRFSREDTELIVINDAADQDRGDEIHSALQKHPNDQAYLFEHEKEKGRGFCLNEGLAQAEGSLIWAPLKADRLNESLLSDAIRRFKSDPAAFWSLDYHLPREPAEWIRMGADGELPDDSCLIWNRNVISAKDLFFNLFLDQFHGAELAMRLSAQYNWHTTDPFFVVSDNQSPLAGKSDLSELIQSLIRIEAHPETRAELFELLQQNQKESGQHGEDHLAMARRYFKSGDAKKALDHISRFLKRNPGHHEATRMKVIALEKLRQHVEAAELKHQLKLQEKELRLHEEKLTGEKSERVAEPEEPALRENDSDVPEPRTDSAATEMKKEEPSLDETEERDPLLTIVIPTAGAGRPLLETALVELESVTDSSRTNLIVIDNASIDDTFDYLQQLQGRKFMNIQVVTNKSNRGFGASVNQGIELADTDFVWVMHNDLYPEEGAADTLMEILRNNPDVMLAAPMIDQTSNPAQQLLEDEEAELIEMKTADSCCFMVRSDIPVRFDESFGLCHFEMDDFCRQVRSKRGVIAAIPAASVTHKEGETTGMMGLRMTPQLKWKNREMLVEKWGEPRTYRIPEQGDHPDRFIRLGAPENPADPPDEWVIAVQNYLSDEVKTDILRRSWSEDELMTIVSTLLIADERELLRALEDKLNDLEIDPSLLLLFTSYYFRKNIYSRCRHYLKKAGDSHPAFDLYRLKILVADKEIDEAAPLLTELMTRYPASPDLFQVAGDLYKVAGDDDEAKSFYALANQTDPNRFKTEDTAFEIRL